MSRSAANWLLYTPFVLIYVFFVRPHLSAGNWLIDALGFVLILAGLTVRIVSRDWKASHGSSGVVVTGPYAVVRNPMYVGSFLIGLGFCAIIGNIPFLIGFAVVYGIVHETVVRREERFLLGRWQEEYAAYLRSVPAWLPSPVALIRYLRSDKPSSSFQAAVLRELNTICGALVGAFLFKADRAWRASSSEVTIFMALAATVLIVWIAFSLRPARNKV